ncbi:MAG: type II secretion system protein GspD [Bryobacteraceae bacterium]
MGYVCLALILLAPLFVQGQTAQPQSAGRLARQARQAERNKQYTQAYLLYAQAAAANPADPRLWVHAQTLRRLAMEESKWAPPGSDPLEDLETEDTIGAEELAEAARPQPPAELRGAPGPHSFDLTGDSRELWEKIASALKLDVVFDGDYQPLPRMRFRIQDADFGEVLYALTSATSSFPIAISDRLALIARDTPQKRQEMEPHMTVTLPLPNPVTVQEAQELARAVQQAFELQRFGVDNVRRLILVRDRISKVKPAIELLKQLLHHRAEVMLEIELLEYTETASTSYGSSLPTRSPLIWLSSLWNSKPDLTGAGALLGFGSGATFFGLGLGSAELFASFSNVQARNLMKAEVRSRDGQAATFHLGDRYPILTAGYFGSVPDGSDVFTPPPTFNFEDLGFVLKATPRVHGEDELTLEIEAEFKVLTGEASNGIPVIANRRFVTRPRLRFGEWAVMAGLFRGTEAKTLTGLAGLAQLPVLGHVLGQNTRDSDRGELILLIKPRLLSAPPGPSDSYAIWIGSEGRPRSGF